MWHRIAAFVIKFRLFLLLLLLISSAYMGYKASQVELSYEFTSAIPKDSEAYRVYQDFREKFGEDGNTMVIGLQTQRFFDSAFYASYRDMVRDIQSMEGIQTVLSVPGSIQLVRDDQSRKLKVMPIPADGSSSARLAREEFTHLPFYQGLLWNPETGTYLMAVRIDQQVLNSKKRNGLVEAIEERAQAFGQQWNLEMHYSGLPFIRTMMATQVQDEMILFLILSLVFTAIILALFFRSFMAVVASMLVVSIGVIWSMGIMSMLGYKITLLTALIPPLIVVIGIPNCVYFLNKYHAEYQAHGNKMKALVRMVDRMGIVTLFTNLTAAIGFGVFYFTQSSLLNEFGLVAAAGIMAMFGVTLIFIPAVFSLLPAPKGRHIKYLNSRWMEGILATLTHWVFHGRQWIYGLTALVSLLAVLGVTRLQSVGYIVDDLPKTGKIYKDLRFFEQHFQGVMPLEILVDSRKKQGALSLPFLQKMDLLATHIHSYPQMGHVLAVSEGVKFARQAYYDGDSEQFAIPTMMEGSFIQPYLRMNSSGTGPLSDLSRSFVDEHGQVARMSVNMADVGSRILPGLIDSIQSRAYQIFDTSRYDLEFTGASIVFLEGSRFIIHSLRDSLILAFLMIFGCMILLFPSWRIVLIALVINLVPLLITAGLMGWAGIPMKPSTVLVFSVALGITIDVTIRFLVNFKQEWSRKGEDISTTVRSTIKDTGISIIYTSLILTVGFGVFALSGFQGTQSLGLLTSLTLVLAMITNLSLQPAFLLWMEKSLKKKRDQRWITDDPEAMERKEN